MKQVVWSPEALADAETYAERIALDNPIAAADWYDKVLEKASLVGEHPGAGVVVPEFADDQLRQFTVVSHRLIYRVEEDRVLVIRIWHGARLLTELDIETPKEEE
ncbi:MAG: type II toxin-antitoxin system RelE/ParE family toxin [Planctomycetes bacterium]|nr:type II toxin-antitoxin system RelE/ParE family toxin [Planctomycetota bacterium]